MARSFDISRKLVWQAYKQVKANKGAEGIDGQTLEDFEQDLKGNLYKIWNRMTSGSYIPPAVMAVTIPKRSGGTRVLGIPAISDRIAQTVVKLYLEPELEPYFHADSYGYRPGKSAIQAVSITRERCWRYGWLFEFDIKGAFDNIDHVLLTRALRKLRTVSGCSCTSTDGSRHRCSIRMGIKNSGAKVRRKAVLSVDC